MAQKAAQQAAQLGRHCHRLGMLTQLLLTQQRGAHQAGRMRVYVPHLPAGINVQDRQPEPKCGFLLVVADVASTGQLWKGLQGGSCWQAWAGMARERLSACTLWSS